MVPCDTARSGISSVKKKKEKKCFSAGHRQKISPALKAAAPQLLYLKETTVGGVDSEAEEKQSSRLHPRRGFLPRAGADGASRAFEQGPPNTIHGTYHCQSLAGSLHI